MFIKKEKHFGAEQTLSSPLFLVGRFSSNKEPQFQFVSDFYFNLLFKLMLKKRITPVKTASIKH